MLFLYFIPDAVTWGDSLIIKLRKSKIENRTLGLNVKTVGMHVHLEDEQLPPLGYKLENESESEIQNLLGQLRSKEAMKGRTNDRHRNQRDPNGVPAQLGSHHIGTIIGPWLFWDPIFFFYVRLTDCPQTHMKGIQR